MLKFYKEIFRKNRLIQALIIISGAIIVACDGDTPEPGPTLKLREMAPQEVSLINTSNDFAIDLITSINKSDQDENVFISPFNMSMGLGMLLNGAEGETGEEIKWAMGLHGLDSRDLNKAFSEINSLLEIMDDRVSLSMANAVWTDLDLRISEGFRSKVMAYYGADVREMDFSKDLSASMINRWVNTKTHGGIPSLFIEIPKESKIILANGIHFSGPWSHHFDAGKTRQEIFRVTEKQSVKSTMMQSSGIPGKWLKLRNFTFAEMNYSNGHYCFSVLLPESGYSLDQLLEYFDTDVYNQLIEDSDSLYFQMKMPKFKISYESSMVDVLKSRGLQMLFSDRSDMGLLLEEYSHMQVSEIRHKAAFEASEYGSFVESDHSGALLDTGGTEAINLNRPFLFIIRERYTGAILFTGILRNPQAG